MKVIDYKNCGRLFNMRWKAGFVRFDVESGSDCEKQSCGNGYLPQAFYTCQRKSIFQEHVSTQKSGRVKRINLVRAEAVQKKSNRNDQSSAELGNYRLFLSITTTDTECWLHSHNDIIVLNL